MAPVSPAQASLLNIKNICLPLLEMSWTVPRCSCESLPLKQPRGLKWALEIGVQHPGDREWLEGGPKDLRTDHPGMFLTLGGSCQEEGLGCAETQCPVYSSGRPLVVCRGLHRVSPGDWSMADVGERGVLGL